MEERAADVAPTERVHCSSRRFAEQECQPTALRDAQDAWTEGHWMSIRTTSTVISFSRPFVLRGIADEQPPGSYTVETDEELLPHVSFPAYRRVATLMRLPPRPGSTERGRIVDLDPLELGTLLAADARAEDQTAALALGAATEPQPSMMREVERSTAGGWKSRWNSWLALNANELTWTALIIGGVILTAIFADR